MPSFERCVVLVADDEATVLRMVSLALTRHGYEVIPAMDGPSALRVSKDRQGPIHLALLDVMMPGMSGPKLWECLQHAYPNIAVLFMSGYRPAQTTEVGSIGDAQFIAKPFLPRVLVQRVNEILGNTDVCVLPDEEVSATRA
jgi:two-component system, cell cycle sensor histidine kinase and response regulator CckA